ncbi:MAG: VOC family protein [Sciscionella sp.]
MSTPATPSISAFLFCADVGASLDFLVAAFGLERGAVHNGPDGRPRNAEAHLGGYTVFLSSPHEGELVPASTLPARHALVMAYVPDVDAVFEWASAAGATVSYEPADMPYGQRECGLHDLDGNLWSFATLTTG